VNEPNRPIVAYIP